MNVSQFAGLSGTVLFSSLRDCTVVSSQAKGGFLMCDVEMYILYASIMHHTYNCYYWNVNLFIYQGNSVPCFSHCLHLTHQQHLVYFMSSKLRRQRTLMLFSSSRETSAADCGLCFQNVTSMWIFPQQTRIPWIMIHVYSNTLNTYKASPHPHFRLSDHISLFLHPAYRQRLKQITLVLFAPQILRALCTTVYSHRLECVSSCSHIENSPVNIEEYAECLTTYISTSTGTGTHHTGQKISKQRPCMNSQVRHAVCLLSCI